MANYLITGGCGFIGSHLVEDLLKDGHSVRILDDFSTGKRENVSTQCDIVEGSVTDSLLVSRCMQDMDGCFHLAAVASVQDSIERWVKTHQVNLGGSVNVFDAAKACRVPIVYASSAAVYGDNADMPLKEISAVRPLTAYGADKLGSELHARVASLVHRVPTMGMRFFNVYGPRQNPSSPYSGVISIFADRILKQKTLTIFGDGEQIRDFIYVKDVVSFLRAAMNKVGLNAAVFNVCTGKTVSINQLAKLMITIARSPVAIEHKPARSGDIRVSRGEPGYARSVLAVEAQRTLVQGLRDYIEYTFDTDLCLDTVFTANISRVDSQIKESPLARLAWDLK